MRSSTRRLFQGIALAAVVAACARYSAEGYRPADDDTIGPVPAHEVARAMREAQMVGPAQPFNFQFEETPLPPGGLSYHCFAYPDGGWDVGLVEASSGERVCSWLMLPDGGPGVRLAPSLRRRSEERLNEIEYTCAYLPGAQTLSRFHVDEAGSVRQLDPNARRPDGNDYASVSVICRGDETVMHAFYIFADGDFDQRLLIFRHADGGAWDATHIR